VRVSDLDLRELLEFDAGGGIIRFAGRRAVVLDTVALGLLRSELIGTLGLTAARGLLTRFGYVHGHRTAESLKADFPWDDEGEWRRAGGKLHTLQGLVVVEPVERPPGDPETPFAEAVWMDSYEAEQHLLHFGQADEPVCWTLCGFASGYLSFCNGREVYCVEERCRGRGDAVCRVVGRFREEWGDAIAPHLAFYEKHSLNESLRDLTNALKRTERRLRSRRDALARADGEPEDPSGLVARSEAMKRVIGLARRVAPVDSTVLLTGESGVGKERLARLVHAESARAGGPFVALNCAAVPEALLESELFGHARGAFTGAVQERAGLLESAGGGTVLLDEVGDVPLAMQAKLLRALQEREVRRVGENRTRRIDARIIAATNRELGEDVLAGRFRQDLYYRLRVVELRVPPLRERREDVLPLARVLLVEISHRLGRRACTLSPQAADQLLRYDWPGNVRELENALERALVLANGGRIEPDDLSEEIRSALPVAYVPGRVRPLADLERDYILAVLRANGGNRTRTAEQLRIGSATLYRKLREYEKGVRS
jgi:DNA-binding NtrC family response regulator